MISGRPPKLIYPAHKKEKMHEKKIAFSDIQLRMQNYNKSIRDWQNLYLIKMFIP